MRSAAIGLLLMLLPVVLVTTVKQSSWGPILAAPASRQIGNPHAKVTIVEYSDFQCPSCARMAPVAHKFLDMYQGKVKLVYKYFPLTRIHKNAMSSAVAAQCASRQNQFWPYAEQLFARQIQWAELTDATTVYMAIAQDVKLDPARFTTCLADPIQKEPIIRDAEEARERQIGATPTFFVGDERLVGGIFESDGARAIEKELRR